VSDLALQGATAGIGIVVAVAQRESGRKSANAIVTSPTTVAMTATETDAMIAIGTEIATAAIIGIETAATTVVVKQCITRLQRF